LSTGTHKKDKESAPRSSGTPNKNRSLRIAASAALVVGIAVLALGAIFFSNSDAPIKTGDAAGDFAAHRNPVWTDHAGKALIEKFDTDVTVNSSKDGYNAIAATAVYRSELKLSNDNLYTGRVTVKMADITHFSPFDKIGLSTTRKTVLLADAWTAKDNAQIRGKIEKSLLMYPIGPLKSVIDPIGVLPTLLYDPALKVSDFDWDIVPCDRLIGWC